MDDAFVEPPVIKELNEEEDEDNLEVLNNSQNVLTKIANFYAEQLMSDIVLVVGEHRYPAHRVILCASSEVFHVMLLNPEWNECRKNVIELKEEPYVTEVFPQFLKYLYIGQINISLQTAMPVLALADKYDIKDLVQLCVDYMLKHVAKAAHQGYLVSWLQYTISFAAYHETVTNALKYFLKWNLKLVSEAKDFADLDVSIMALLLQQNDLIVKSEYDLFQILEKWLLFKKEQIECDCNLSDEDKTESYQMLIEMTIKHIRFAMMTPCELAHMLLSPIVESHKLFLVPRMAIGMSYHGGQKEKIYDILKNEPLQFTPRLYTCDNHSTIINLKDFDQFPEYSNYVSCFFTHKSLAEHEDDKTVMWETEFFPRGIKYNRAKLIWGGDVPETVLKTVRLKVTCRNYLQNERFKISVLITGVQNQIEHIMTIRERTEYFSDSSSNINIDNLIPYDELALSSIKLSQFLVGSKRNDILLQVVITPMGQYTSRSSPQLEFK